MTDLADAVEQPTTADSPQPPPKRRWWPRPSRAAKQFPASPVAEQSTAKLPRPPKRQPRLALPAPPLRPAQLLMRSSLSLLSLILLGVLLNVTVLSQLQYVIAQQQLRAVFAEQLAAGTAPVSEGTFEDVLLTNGGPVARIEIPTIGVDTIVVEGTSAGTLTAGPGHRRDTRLPGQVGVSILLGRANAYGGPFGSIQSLVPGETINVVTGQGEHRYEVIGVRYAGDPSPPPLAAAEGRLILETARGYPFAPVGVVRVDARLVSEVLPAGPRETTGRTLPPSHRELAIDTGTVWALVFALQFLVVAEAATVWAYYRVGGAKTWVVAAPVLLLAGLLVADQLVRLLPNLT